MSRKPKTVFKKPTELEIQVKKKENMLGVVQDITYNHFRVSLLPKVNIATFERPVKNYIAKVVWVDLVQDSQLRLGKDGKCRIKTGNDRWYTGSTITVQVAEKSKAVKNVIPKSVSQVPIYVHIKKRLIDVLTSKLSIYFDDFKKSKSGKKIIVDSTTHIKDIREDNRQFVQDGPPPPPPLPTSLTNQFDQPNSTSTSQPKTNSNKIGQIPKIGEEPKLLDGMSDKVLTSPGVEYSGIVLTGNQLKSLNDGLDNEIASKKSENEYNKLSQKTNKKMISIDRKKKKDQKKNQKFTPKKIDLRNSLGKSSNNPISVDEEEDEEKLNLLPMQPINTPKITSTPPKQEKSEEIGLKIHHPPPPPSLLTTKPKPKSVMKEDSFSIKTPNRMLENPQKKKNNETDDFKNKPFPALPLFHLGNSNFQTPQNQGEQSIVTAHRESLMSHSSVEDLERQQKLLQQQIAKRKQEMEILKLEEEAEALRKQILNNQISQRNASQQSTPISSQQQQQQLIKSQRQPTKSMIPNTYQNQHQPTFPLPQVNPTNHLQSNPTMGNFGTGHQFNPVIFSQPSKTTNPHLKRKERLYDYDQDDVVTQLRHQGLGEKRVDFYGAFSQNYYQTLDTDLKVSETLKNGDIGAVRSIHTLLIEKKVECVRKSNSVSKLIGICEERLCNLEKGQKKPWEE